MTLQNPDWYDLNESRSWPIADQATGRDDDGDILPHDVIADLQLRFPTTYGDYAHIGSVTVSESLASVTFVSDTGEPLAAVSIVNPQVGIHYAVSPFQSGVGGWVVFGTGVNDAADIRTWRFSTSSQTVIAPQCARRYRVDTLSGIGRLGAVGRLTGLVRLAGGNDLEIVKETREILGVVRDVGVIRLKSNYSVSESENVLAKYRGPCGGRAESGSCDTPIEFVNGVGPDCCGVLYVELKGCSEIRQIDGECGVVVECGFGLSEACITADKLPTADGTLPNEYTDGCDEESLSISVLPNAIIGDSFSQIAAIDSLATDGQAEPPGGAFKTWADSTGYYDVVALGQVEVSATGVETGPYIVEPLADAAFDAALEFAWDGTNTLSIGLQKIVDASNMAEASILLSPGSYTLRVRKQVAGVWSVVNTAAVTPIGAATYTLYASFEDDGSVTASVSPTDIVTGAAPETAAATTVGFYTNRSVSLNASVSRFVVAAPGDIS